MTYPTDQGKTFWDIFMTIILLITCILTPLQLAYSDDDDNMPWISTTNYIIDGLFAVDMIVIFNSAYYDEEHFKLVLQR